MQRAIIKTILYLGLNHYLDRVQIIWYIITSKVVSSNTANGEVYS